MVAIPLDFCCPRPHHQLPRLAVRGALTWLWAFGLGLLTVSPGALHGQGATDIYWAPVVVKGDQVGLGEVRNLTDRDGYDNQPAFSADGSHLYYSSQRGQGDGAQTDIWQLAWPPSSAEPRPLFETPESEYSPTPIPGRRALSVVRVETDGTQKLWRLPLPNKRGKTKGEARRVLEDVEPVGYHAWIDRELVLFVLGEPHELRRLSAGRTSASRTSAGRTLAKDIGRALKPIPGRRAFSFVHKTANDGWWIKSLDVESDEIRPLIKTRPEREDFAWSPGGELWMGDGTALYRARPEADGWTPVADLAGQGFGNITRLTLSADGRHLVFVADRAAEPGSPTESH